MKYPGDFLDAGERLPIGSASRGSKRRGFLVAALVVGLAAAGACTTTPSATGEAGAWTGTVTSTPFGSGTLVFSLADSGSPLTGTWTLTYPNTADSNTGALVWTLSGSAVTLTMTPALPVPATCVYNFTATISNTTSMSGTYSTANCTLADTGTFTATLGG